MEKKPTIIYIAPEAPDFGYFDRGRITYLKELLQDVTRIDDHPSIRIVIELYESGQISAAHPQDVYIQDGKVFFDEYPPNSTEHPLWAEVRLLSSFKT
jgi:hypothetical protein